MFVTKNFTLRNFWTFAGPHIIWLTVWSTIAVVLIEVLHNYGITQFDIPWLPVSLVGTAVAFYVGLKNNSAYDRLWEARKIWGGIVNTSRMWGSNTIAYVGNTFREHPVEEKELERYRKRLIYGHIGWLYTLRKQLLQPTAWEHINQNKLVALQAKKIMKMYSGELVLDEVTERSLKSCFSENEINSILDFKNTAAQMINEQSQLLKELRDKNLIDDFRHMELQKLLNDLYTHQGKAERIKKFPFPRQYGGMSTIFVGVFIFLLPFGLLNVFHPAMGPDGQILDISKDWGAWISIPFSVLVGWIFLMMELVGDYSENPFEGLGNDIPMLSLCKTIEIDLREMLGETELPKPEEPRNGVLM